MAAENAAGSAAATSALRMEEQLLTFSD